MRPPSVLLPALRMNLLLALRLKLRLNRPTLQTPLGPTVSSCWTRVPLPRRENWYQVRRPQEGACQPSIPSYSRVASPESTRQPQ